MSEKNKNHFKSFLLSKKKTRESFILNEKHIFSFYNDFCIKNSSAANLLFSKMVKNKETANSNISGLFGYKDNCFTKKKKFSTDKQLELNL